MALFKVTVAEIVEETPAIKTFRLVRTDGRPFDPYVPGAHVDVVGPTAVMRQYSLCSPPAQADSYVVAVKKETDSRGGSQALHEHLQTGDELEISAPRNLLKVAEQADCHHLFAAGIGITPMISIAYHLERAGQPFQLHYFARSREEAAFVDLLENRSGFAERVRFHFGVKRDDQETVIRQALENTTDQTQVYACGPEGFMDKIVALAGEHIPQDNVHIEHFQAGEVHDATANTAFEVELEDTGEVFEVPADKSIVEVLRENDVEIETSCQEGICGTCIMTVLEGEPDHRDNCLTTSEKKANDQMAICVSRAKSQRLRLEFF
jgi:ferredoxin-NADP reductase